MMGLLLVTGCTSSTKKKHQAALHLNLGASMLTRGNYRGALYEIRQAEKLDPSSPPVQNNLGLVYYLLDQPQLAEKHLLKSIQLDPNFSDAHNNLARVLIDLGKFDESQQHAKKVIDDLTYPSPEKAWLNLGLSYFTQRRFDRAVPPLEKAATLDPNNCMAHTLLGRTQYEIGKFKEAARLLDSGIKHCKSGMYDEPLYFSGLAYYKVGEREKALARLDELMKNYPQGRFRKQAEAMRKLME